MARRRKTTYGRGTVGTFKPPDHDRDQNGLGVTWWGAQRFTRAETRYGLFYQHPPGHWTSSQNCFGTLAEAIKAGEARAHWNPDHVWDFVHQRAVYDFHDRRMAI